MSGKYVQAIAKMCAEGERAQANDFVTACVEHRTN
jgi:hypothetical protein